MSPEAISNGSAPVSGAIANCGGSAPFCSILFDQSAMSVEGRVAPDIFGDLNLDQIVDSITAGRDEYNLKPFFYAPLNDIEIVRYRYDIFRDLEDQVVASYVRSFAKEMREMRGQLSQAGKAYYKYQKQSWFLDAVETYCAAVTQLSNGLMQANIGSSGFRAFRGYLASYIVCDSFRRLVAETHKLRADLAGIRYSLHIAGKRITVSKYDNEVDYSVDVLQTFEKFSQGAAKEYRFRYNSPLDMNHVEAAVLDLVADLFPDVFSSLEKYCNLHRDYLASTIARFDREVQFYIACLEHVHRLKSAGLPFCYPEVTNESKEIYGNGVFDLALANKLVGEGSCVVPNDFYLKDPERILIVSGPNQGGKTTFARTFGQLHHLASVGCPVAGTDARLFLFDKLFTHFEKDEDIRNLSGKLEDELRRIHRILESATPKSILIMNESFLSTALKDALFLSKQIMLRIVALDMLCLSVTFLDELTSFSETTVSMVSTVNPTDPALRTFKVVRRPANGLAYAVAIAQKYRLTHDAIKTRIAGEKGGI
jgi:DNA mismatch repair protein MutS